MGVNQYPSSGAAGTSSPPPSPPAPPTLITLIPGRFSIGPNNWSTYGLIGPGDVDPHGWRGVRGSGADPDYRWNDTAHAVLPGGTVIEKFIVKARGYTTTHSDWELIVAATYPLNPANPLAAGSGYNDIADMAVDVVYRGLRSTWTSPPVTGTPVDHWVHQTVEIGYTVPAVQDMADIKLYMRVNSESGNQVYVTPSMVVRLP